MAREAREYALMVMAQRRRVGHRARMMRAMMLANAGANNAVAGGAGPNVGSDSEEED